MGRILFWLLLGIAVYFAWRWWQATLRGPRSTDASAAGRARGSHAGEPMVACETCGLNLPQSEALTFNGRTYCCEEHRRRASSGN